MWGSTQRSLRVTVDSNKIPSSVTVGKQSFEIEVEHRNLLGFCFKEKVRTSSNCEKLDLLVSSCSSCCVTTDKGVMQII